MNLTKEISSILCAHEHACKKHPIFCKKILLDNNPQSYHEYEKFAKTQNKGEGGFVAENILLEEVYEALNAYAHGDLENSLDEFAQCGAVIIRIMRQIETELEQKELKK